MRGSECMFLKLRSEELSSMQQPAHQGPGSTQQQQTTSQAVKTNAELGHTSKGNAY